MKVLLDTCALSELRLVLSGPNIHWWLGKSRCCRGSEQGEPN